MKATKPSRSRVAPDESLLCQFPFADGRRCRMLRQQGHPYLCAFHAREEQQLLELEQIAAELCPPSGQLITATHTDKFIRKLFQLAATNRIPIRNVQVFARLAELLLYSQKLARQELSLAQAHFNPPAKGSASK